jgi:hypothetical protein
LDAGDGVDARTLEALFDVPPLGLQWTGSGVRHDRCGRLHHVRFATVPLAADLDAHQMAVAEVPKILLVQTRRPERHADVRDWLLDLSCESRPRVVARLLRTVTRGVEAGEVTLIGFEPSSRRTRIIWPWNAGVEVADISFMRRIWCAYLVTSDSSRRSRTQ